MCEPWKYQMLHRQRNPACHKQSMGLNVFWGEGVSERLSDRKILIGSHHVSKGDCVESRGLVVRKWEEHATG